MNAHFPPPAEKLQAALNKASDQLLASRAAKVQQPMPEVLYHYTDAKGLEGILASQRLWATDYRYVNDSSEITYAHGLLEKLIAQKLSSAAITNAQRLLLEGARTSGKLFSDVWSLYITCFSSSDSLLHQWRTYADAGGGFAIGIETKWISWVENGRTEDLPTLPLFLARAVYDEPEQQLLLSEILDSALDLVSRQVDPLPDEQKQVAFAHCAYFFAAHLAPVLACIKHPAFSIEQEWRLSFMPARQTLAKVRHGIYGLTPYMELDVRPRWKDGTTKGLPIVSITHAPSLNPDATKHALNQLLHGFRYRNVEIRGSALPMRIV